MSRRGHECSRCSRYSNPDGDTSEQEDWERIGEEGWRVVCLYIPGEGDDCGVHNWLLCDECVEDLEDFIVPGSRPASEQIRRMFGRRKKDGSLETVDEIVERVCEIHSKIHNAEEDNEQ